MFDDNELNFQGVAFPSDVEDFGEADFKNVNYFEWMDTSLNSSDERVSAVVREVNETFNIARSNKQIQALEIVILNLLHAASQSPNMWIGYSRNSNDYTFISRYHTTQIGYRPIVTNAVNKLIGFCLLDHCLGYYSQLESGSPRKSRVRASERLRAIFEKYGAYRAQINKPPYKEVIVLKDAEKNLFDYNDTDATNQMRQRLTAYNAFLSNCDIRIEDLPVPVKFYGLVRVFNKESFKLGGRFYRGWWQGIESEFRQFITVNGQQTVEIDFRGLHIRMLYAKLGRDYRDDPYTMEGITKPSPMRDLLKSSLLTMLNAGGEHEALLAILNDIRNDPNKKKIFEGLSYSELQDLLNRFRSHHPDLEEAGFFYQGQGLSLQNEDSEIMGDILDRCLALNIPALPIHDSVIIPVHDQAVVEGIMCSSSDLI